MSLFASVFGDTSSDVITILLIGVIALVATQIGPPELGAVIVLSLIVIAATSNGAFVKAMVMMATGTEASIRAAAAAPHQERTDMAESLSGLPSAGCPASPPSQRGGRTGDQRCQHQQPRPGSVLIHPARQRPLHPAGRADHRVVGTARTAE